MTESSPVGHWFGGKATDGGSHRTAPVFNPATGAVAAQVVLADAADVDEAVRSAAEASPRWSQASLSARTKVMFRFRELVAAQAAALAGLITDEHGKVLSDALGEVQRGLEVIEFACGLPQLLKGEFSDQVSTGVDAFSFREPLGVVAGITPFNFPVMVPLWMCPVAIATGNAFILKPSERDPSASLLLAELWQRAGLPDGIFSVVQGDKVAVDAILDHPGIAAVSFVGSTPVARYVHGRATAAGKRVQALGGAKNHAVVLPDADLDNAASHLVAAAYGSAGERCMAISVAVAVGDAADRLVPLLEGKARAVKVGSGRDPESEMGPLVTEAARDRISAYIGRAADDGASRPGRRARCARAGRRERVLPRPDAHRPGHPVGRGLHRGAVRPRARRRARAHPGRRDRADQRQSVRQRDRDLHRERRRRPSLPARRARRDDRR